MPKTVDRNEQIAAFDTGSLLRTVDDLDVMRGHLKGDNFNAPEMRHDLLRLHGLAMRFVNEGHTNPIMAEEMFDLAADLECRIQDLSDALVRMLAPIRRLQALEPSDQVRLSCPLLSGPSTMRVWIKEGTTNACEKAQARRDHREAA